MSSASTGTLVAFVLGEVIGALLMLVAVVFVARRIGFEGAGDINLVGRVRLSNLSHASLFFLVGAAFAGGSIYLMLHSTSDASATAARAVDVAAKQSTTPVSSQPKPKPKATLRVVRIDGRTVGATASVEHGAEAGFTYGVENTLDRDRTTAWNGVGPSSGAVLTYSFERPVRLDRIELLNGYAKTADAFAENARLKVVSIVTDAGRFTRTLADTAQWQVLHGPFGLTRGVRLVVGSVYPGSRFNDAALTEIAFLGTLSGQ